MIGATDGAPEGKTALSREKRNSKPYTNANHIDECNIVSGATVQPGQDNEDTEDEHKDEEKEEGGRGKKSKSKNKKSEQIKVVDFTKVTSKESEKAGKKHKTETPTKERGSDRKTVLVETPTKERGSESKDGWDWVMQHEGQELRGCVLKSFPSSGVALVSLDERVPEMVGQEGVLVSMDPLNDPELEKKMSVADFKVVQAQEKSGLVKDAFWWEKGQGPLVMLLRSGANLVCPKSVVDRENEKDRNSVKGIEVKMNSGSAVANPTVKLDKGFFWLDDSFRRDPKGSDSDEDDQEQQKAPRKVCNHPWPKDEDADCVKNCITINVVVIGRYDKLTTSANLLRSYPKELLHTYEAYHRDDGSDVPMSQLGFDTPGGLIPGKEAGGKKHRMEGWVRLASFMPIESLLGPCEFSQDTMSKASREKILKVKDATSPTGVFPEGESCNIWWPKDCPPSPPPPPPPPSSSSSSSSTTTTSSTSSSSSSSSTSTTTTTTTTAAFGQASEIPSDVQDEVAKLMQEKAAAGKAAAAAATTTTSRGGKRTIVAEKNKAAKRRKTTPTAKGSDAQECSPSEAVPEELAEEKEKSSNEEEGPCNPAGDQETAGAEPMSQGPSTPCTPTEEVEGVEEEGSGTTP
eukprot:g29807.t1